MSQNNVLHICQSESSSPCAGHIAHGGVMIYRNDIYIDQGDQHRTDVILSHPGSTAQIHFKASRECMMYFLTLNSFAVQFSFYKYTLTVQKQLMFRIGVCFVPSVQCVFSVCAAGPCVQMECVKVCCTACLW